MAAQPLPDTPSAAPSGGRPWSPGEIARGAARGALALSARQVLVHGMNVLGGILLARLLTPAEFGVYGILVFLVGFLIAFGDVGLGASLIRERSVPSEHEYRAVFTAQQLLVGAVIAILWIAAPALASAYQRPAAEAWVFRAAAFSLLFASLQTIPSIRLERELAFHKLGGIEVAQAAVFNGLAVGLSARGLGVYGLVGALLARSAVGAVLASLVSRWPIGWAWDPALVRRHLRFGLPYQGIALVSTIKDSITPVLIGLTLGTAAVGYVNWAGMVAAYPVLLLMAFQRVYLPTFARMQEHRDALPQFVERVLGATNTLVAPLATLTLVLAVPATRLVFGDKWLPALPLFYLLWGANLFVPTMTPLMALLNAQGRSGTAFRFALLWAGGTWVLGAPLIARYGAIGFAMANLVIQLSNLLLLREVRRRVAFRARPVVVPPWCAAAVAGGAVLVLARVLPPTTLPGLVAVGLAGLVLYLLLLAAYHRRALRTWIHQMRTLGWRLVSP